MRADLRKPPLGGLAEAVVHGSRDRELEHAVAEELEPLVGRGTIVRPGGVREDLLEAGLGKRVDETAQLLWAVQPFPGSPTPGGR